MTRAEAHTRKEEILALKEEILALKEELVALGPKEATIQAAPKGETTTDGAYYALFAKGAQDATIASSRSGRDALFSNGEGYQVVNRRLPETCRWCGQNVVSIELAREYDCVSRVDLALRLPEGLGINDVVARIDTEVGGSRFDTFSVRDDIEMQVRATCALLGREQPSKEGAWTFLPLELAPLHAGTDYFPVAAAEWHPVKVRVTFKVPMADADVQLHGDVYFLESVTRRMLANASFEFTTVQSQYTGPELVKAGADAGYAGDFKRGGPGIPLTFNHPVHAIFFWGHDPAKVTRVRLMLDGAAFYDGGLEALDRAKRGRSLGMPPGVAVIFFTDVPVGTATSRSSVNFSRIDNARLVLTTAEDATVHVVGMNMQPVTVMAGMAGLRFSK